MIPSICNIKCCTSNKFCIKTLYKSFLFHILQTIYFSCLAFNLMVTNPIGGQKEYSHLQTFGGLYVKIQAAVSSE